MFPYPLRFLLFVTLATVLGSEDSRMAVDNSMDSDSAVSLEDSRSLPDGRGEFTPSNQREESKDKSVNVTSRLLRDKEWRYMVHTNPYPDICRAQDFSDKEKMKLCILQQMWQELLPANTRRSEEYDLIYELQNILPVRQNEGDGDKMDCLINSRTKMISQRQVPYDCYKPYPESKELHYEWFLYEIANDLRFTFDYVLFDDTGNTQNQAKFWYLILYLKKMATELPNPFMTATIIQEVNANKNQFKQKVLDIRNQVKTFRRDIRYEIRSLLQTINDFRTNLEVIIHMEKLNINSNILEHINIEKPWYVILGNFLRQLFQNVTDVIEVSNSINSLISGLGALVGRFIDYAVKEVLNTAQAIKDNAINAFNAVGSIG